MKKLASIATLFILVAVLSSCAQKLTFATSSVVPAATGNVKIKNDKNNNYSVDVNILNLAEAKHLTPARSTYVVWSEGADNNVTNLGQINTSSHLFSKALKGELSAVTTTKPKRIFITAEDDGKVQYPSTQVVLQTQ